MARYIKFVDALNKVVRVILVGMFIVMFLTAFLQVIIRNMTTGSIPWSDELCRYLIIFIVWLGAGLAARSNRLIRMEVLPSLTKCPTEISILCTGSLPLFLWDSQS